MRTPATSTPRRRRWTVRELVLLVLSTALILSPVGALAYTLLQPRITLAQDAPDLRVSKVATSLGGIDIANIAPGGEFYYEMRVQTSSTESVNVTLLDSFPGTVQALTITDRVGGTCTLTANQLTCSLVASASSEASVLVRTRASTTAPSGTQVSNTVLVTAGAASARGTSTLTITGPGNQPSPTIAVISPTTAPPTNTPAPTAPPATDTPAPTGTTQATPTNTAAPTDTAEATTPTATATVPSATPTPVEPTATRRADEATATSAALTVIPVTTATATVEEAEATATATARETTVPATTPTATEEFTVTPSAEATLVAQGTAGPTTQPSTPTATAEVVPPTATAEVVVPPTAIPATVIPTLAAPNTNAPTALPPAPTALPPAPTSVPAGGVDSNTVPPASDGGKEPPATSPEVTGRTLPATSGEQWLWLAPLFGLVLLFHTVRTRRARLR